jgi:hypothetical protein
MYALPYWANKSAVVTVGKPIGGDPPARVGDMYVVRRCNHLATLIAIRATTLKIREATQAIIAILVQEA